MCFVFMIYRNLGWLTCFQNSFVVFFYNFSAFHHDLYVEIVIEYSTFYHDFVLSVTISLLSVTISRNSITIYQPQNFPEGFCFGNPRSRSIVSPKNRKSYLENRKSYEFLNAIFVLEILDQDRQWRPKIEKAISRTVRATNY